MFINRVGYKWLNITSQVVPGSSRINSIARQSKFKHSSKNCVTMPKTRARSIKEPNDVLPEKKEEVEVRSKYFTQNEESKSKKPRKHLKISYDSPRETLGTSSDFPSWEPPDWRTILENIREMRKAGNAPVDHMGCAQCADKNESPEVFRFQTLVSLMLSSQTKDEVTFSAMQKLKAHGLNIQNILATTNEKLGELIYPAGFWKRKVEFIKKTCAILEKDYDGDIPDTLEGLCSLPGVGPKMAFLVLTIGWGRTEGICVDTHVHRISNRLKWVHKSTKQPEETRLALQAWMPRELWEELNGLLVGFGQTVCLPVSPKCSQCLNKKLCPSSQAKH